MNNPAGRLFSLLADFQSIAAGTSSSCAEVWVQVFGIASSNPEFVVRLGDVATLLPEAMSRLDAAGYSDHATNLGALAPTISRSFNVTEGFFVSADSAKQAVDDTAQTILNMSATILSRELNDGLVPSPDDLEDFGQRISTLIDDVRNTTEFPDALKDLLVARLLKVMHAMEEIRFRGPSGVREATELLAVTASIAVGQAESAQTKTTLRKMSETVGIVLAACGLITTVQTTVLDTVTNLPQIVSIVQDIADGEVPSLSPGDNGDLSGEAATRSVG